MASTVEDLTIDDIAEVERISGQPLADLGSTTAMKGNLMKAVVFVLKRRDNPAFTLEDAGKMTMREMNEVLEGDPSMAS